MSSLLTNGVFVPLYKGKRKRGECSSYRGPELLSVPRETYGRVLIERLIRAAMGRGKESLEREEDVPIRFLPLKYQ